MGFKKNITYFGFIFTTLVLTNMDLTGSEDTKLLLSGNFLAHMEHLDKAGCSRVNTDIGLIAMEAMIYACEQIRRTPGGYFPQGYQLEYDITDLCTSRKKVYEAIIPKQAMVAIGAYSSVQTEFWSKFLWVWNKCLISYGATNPDFVNRKKFPGLYATVPSDNLSSFALSELAMLYRWHYVGVLHAYSEDGYPLYTPFSESMYANGMCVHYVKSLSKDAQRAEYVFAIDALLELPKVKTVFLFLSYEGCQNFFQAIADRSHQLRGHQFVVSPRCGTMLNIPIDMQRNFEGMITLQISDPFPADFERYFRTLNPRNKAGAINERFFNEYWEILHNCSLTLDANCSKLPHDGFNRFTPVRPVIKAVHAAAKALRAWLVENCNDSCVSYECEKRCKKELDIRNLNKYLKDVLRDDGKLMFNNAASTFDDYDIFQYQRVKNSTSFQYGDEGREFEFRKVGTWSMSRYDHTEEHGWDINESLLKAMPESVCSETCRSGQVRVNLGECCWRCRWCHPTDEYVTENTCRKCPRGYKRNPHDATLCFPLPVEQISIDDAPSYAIATVSTIALTCCLLIMAIYVRNRTKLIIKATSFPLALCSLMGLMLMFVAPLVYLQSPTVVICHAQKVLFGLSLTLCYSPLLLKTNRVFRIFTSSGKFKLRSLMLVSMTSQFMLILGMVSVQMLMTIFWIINDSPPILETFGDQSGLRECHTTRESMTMNTLFPLTLIIASAVYAYKTRNLPATYSEIKSIGITMYVTLFNTATCLALAMLLPTERNFTGTYIICLVFLSCGIVNLIGQYAMKVVALYFKKHDNDTNQLQTNTFNYPSSPTVSRLRISGGSAQSNGGFSLDDGDHVVNNPPPPHRNSLQ